jgi:hypothetical protein
MLTTMTMMAVDLSMVAAASLETVLAAASLEMVAAASLDLSMKMRTMRTMRTTMTMMAVDLSFASHLASHVSTPQADIDRKRLLLSLQEEDSTVTELNDAQHRSLTVVVIDDMNADQGVTVPVDLLIEWLTPGGPMDYVPVLGVIVDSSEVHASATMKGSSPIDLAGSRTFANALASVSGGGGLLIGPASGRTVVEDTAHGGWTENWQQFSQYFHLDILQRAAAVHCKGHGVKAVFVSDGQPVPSKAGGRCDGFVLRYAQNHGVTLPSIVTGSAHTPSDALSTLRQFGISFPESEERLLRSYSVPEGALNQLGPLTTLLAEVARWWGVVS